MCDTIVSVSERGVLLAKNSDRDPNEAQRLEWHPGETHQPGAGLRCTWIEIPQVPRTAAILISRPFWIWGAEMGANEHGVAIGNEAVFTREPYAATGLTGMDLLRLALERADTAQRAAEVIAGLLGRHGQGGGCGHERRSMTYHNSFAIADSSEAWILETAGRHWALERVGAGVRTISNGLTIPDFAARYGERLKTTACAAGARRRLTGAAAGERPNARALMSALRSHGPTPWPRYRLANGAMAAPCMHAGGLLAASQTTASWISDLRRGGGLHWATATAAPCTSIFKPFRVEEPVELGPEPSDRFDPRTLWWRHELLHRCAMRDPGSLPALFAPERDALERAWLIDPPSGEQATAQAEAALARWTEAVQQSAGADRRPAHIRRYWSARDRRAGMPASSARPADRRAAQRRIA
jgi:secernin